MHDRYIQDEGRLLSALITFMSGGDLLSQGVPPQVPSALAGLTSVFGMGTGCSPPLSPPDKSIADVMIRPHSSHLEHSIASTSFRIQIQALGLLVPVC
jgi:hypothetical protein